MSMTRYYHDVIHVAHVDVGVTTYQRLVVGFYVGIIICRIKPTWGTEVDGTPNYN